MKIRLPFVAVAAFLSLTMFSSCVRDYVCQCTITYKGAPGLPDSSVAEYKVRDTKDKAASVCEESSGTYQTGDITTTETCKLY